MNSTYVKTNSKPIPDCFVVNSTSPESSSYVYRPLCGSPCLLAPVAKLNPSCVKSEDPDTPFPKRLLRSSIGRLAGGRSGDFGDIDWVQFYTFLEQLNWLIAAKRVVDLPRAPHNRRSLLEPKFARVAAKIGWNDVRVHSDARSARTTCLFRFCVRATVLTPRRKGRPPWQTRNFDLYLEWEKPDRPTTGPAEPPLPHDRYAASLTPRSLCWPMASLRLT